MGDTFKPRKVINMQKLSYSKLYALAMSAQAILAAIRWFVVIKKLGLIMSGSASFYLSGAFFWQMSGDTVTAIVFLVIGLSAELGKYCAVVVATTHSRAGRTWAARRYYLATALLVTVSVMGSTASLLKKDRQTLTQHNHLQSQLADIEEDIALERKAMSRAADANAQTAGVQPARNNLKELKAEKKALQAQQSTLPPDNDAYTAMVAALSYETRWKKTDVEHRLAVLIALLLESLCLLFAIANTHATPTTTRVVKGSVGGGSVPAKDDKSEPAKADDKFPDLVTAIQNRKLDPTYDNIRDHMEIKSNRVKEVKERLKAHGVVIEDQRGRLIPV